MRQQAPPPLRSYSTVESCTLEKVVTKINKIDETARELVHTSSRLFDLSSLLRSRGVVLANSVIAVLFEAVHP